MDILKYFHEEPASLEVLSDDLDPDARRRDAPARTLEALLDGPRYFRGYLAGTDLSAGRFGLTALAHPAAFAEPLAAMLHGSHGYRAEAGGTVAALSAADVPTILRDPAGVAALAAAEAPLHAEDLAVVAQAERRVALPALRRLLDAGAVVAFPEPAHHGFDWSLFAARPLRDDLVAAFRQHPAAGVRRFAIPVRQARGEHRFYFETWQLDGVLPAYIEEI